MSKILDKEILKENLYNYYIEHYGERSTDEWLDCPAVNAWIFIRDGKRIMLNCHILTGVVKESVRDIE